MGFQNKIIVNYLVLILYIFITLSWTWKGNESTINGFRIYKLLKSDKTQVEILKDNIPPDLRQVQFYMPDNEAWQVIYVATAWSDIAESAYSNEVGLPPRTPDQMELIGD